MVSARSVSAAEARRRAAQEEQRQHLAERARRKHEEFARAAEARKKQADEREKKHAVQLKDLLERSMQANKTVEQRRTQAKQAASERGERWRARADAAHEFVVAMVQKRVESLLCERAGVETATSAGSSTVEGTSTPGTETPRHDHPSKPKVKKRAPRYSAPRVLPPVPQEILQPMNRDAKFVRALYDSQENDALTLRLIAEAEKANEWAQHESLLANVAARYREGNLRHGWAAWHRLWEAYSTRRTALLKCVMYMRHRSRAKCMVQWVHATKRSHQLSSATQRGLRSLFERELSRAWRQLRRLAMRAEKRRAAMRRIVARMLNRDLDRGWATWSQAAKAWRKQQNTMGQVVSYMRNQDLIWGFLSWRETWRVILRQRELIENVGNMLANKDVARGFRGWAVWWQTLRMTQGAMRNIVLHLANRGLSAAWHSWMEALELLRNEAENLVAMQKVGLYLIRRDVTRAWNAWQEMWSETVETKAACSSVLWRMKNLSITRGWNLWAEKAMTYRHNFEAIERAVRYIKNQSLLHGWLPWVEMAAKWAEDARITRVCARFFVYNLKREGLKRWRTFLVDLRAARMQAERWRMLNERWDQRQKQQKKKEGEYVELIDAKDPPEARQLRRKFDRREMLRWEIAQEQLRRTAQRNAALARMKGLDDDEPTRPRPATAPG